MADGRANNIPRQFLKPGDPRRINKPKGATSIKVAFRKLAKLKFSNIKAINPDVAAVLEEYNIDPRGNLLLAMSMYIKALNGDVQAANFVLDRTEGKVPSATEISGPGGSPIVPPVINFVGVKPPDEH